MSDYTMTAASDTLYQVVDPYGDPLAKIGKVQDGSWGVYYPWQDGGAILRETYPTAEDAFHALGNHLIFGGRRGR